MHKEENRRITDKQRVAVDTDSAQCRLYILRGIIDIGFDGTLVCRCVKNRLKESMIRI